MYIISSHASYNQKHILQSGFESNQAQLVKLWWQSIVCLRPTKAQSAYFGIGASSGSLQAATWSGIVTVGCHGQMFGDTWWTACDKSLFDECQTVVLGQLRGTEPLHAFELGRNVIVFSLSADDADTVIYQPLDTLRVSLSEGSVNRNAVSDGRACVGWASAKWYRGERGNTGR